MENVKRWWAGPAPYTQNGKKFALYRYTSSKTISPNKKGLGDDIQTVIVKDVVKREFKNPERYQFSVVMCLDAATRQYAHTQFTDLDSIDIEGAIAQYFNRYTKHGEQFNPNFKNFDVLVRQDPTWKKDQGGATADDNNDCLFQCLNSALQLPKQFKKPENLKAFLNLERTSPVSVSHLHQLEDPLQCSFEVVGDVMFKSAVERPVNVKLKLVNNHWVLLKNHAANNFGVCFTPAKDNEIACGYLTPDGMFKYWDPNTSTICTTAFSKKYDLGFKVIHVIKGKIPEDLKQAHADYIQMADAVKAATKGLIDYRKHNKVSYLLRQLMMMFAPAMGKPDPIDSFEGNVLNQAFRGGLQTYTKGTFEKVWEYDHNKGYAATLNSGYYTFPLRKPTYHVAIGCDEIYGMYRIRIDEGVWNYRVNPEFQWWWHYDIRAMKMLGVKFTLAKDGHINCVKYSEDGRIKGDIFNDLIVKLDKYAFKHPDLAPHIKPFLSAIYGVMCEKNRKWNNFKIGSEPVDIGADFVDEYVMDKSSIQVVTQSSSQPFKRDFARMSSLTAFYRHRIVKQIHKCCGGDFSKVLLVNTDGFLLREKAKPSSITVGTKLGQYKAKCHDSVTIEHCRSYQTTGTTTF